MCVNCDDLIEIEVQLSITKLMMQYDPATVRRTIENYDFDNWTRYAPVPMESLFEREHATWCSYTITEYGECDCS